MTFVHPEFFYLAPLVAIPIVIHLLNRLRYRRVRWAAMAFLLTSERRAVRRARLQQILLMVLRTLVLAAALLALAQPVFRGGLAGLLGGSAQVAVLLDASASMSATDAAGAAFERGRRLAVQALDALPRRTRALAGTFAAAYDCPFAEPVQDHGVAASVLENAERTDGAGDLPAAIRAAAERLAGGGGVVWIITDLRAADWRAADAGAWQEVRQALDRAGRPRLTITDLSPAATANFAVAGMSVSPAILAEGDAPRLTATVAYIGSGAAVANVSLFLDGRRIDSRALSFDAAGRADCVFRLPALEGGAHAGRLELAPDAVPADDTYHFLLRTEARVPLLLVDGAPSTVPFEGAADFLALALHPPEEERARRSPFAVKTVPLAELRNAALADYAAVFLAGAPAPTAAQTAQLERYVTAGGLLVILPAAGPEVAGWGRSGIPGARFQGVEDPDKRLGVDWTAPNNPLTATLPVEGLDRIAVTRFVRIETGPGVESLATLANGAPFLVAAPWGRGRVYCFAVSARPDGSNLPFSPVFLITLHRMVMLHAVETQQPAALPAFSALKFAPPPGAFQVVTPDDRALPAQLDAAGGQAVFARTARAGVYWLQTGGPGAAERAPLAAVDVPLEESELQRIAPAAVRALLPGYPVTFLRAEGGVQQFEAGGEDARTTAAFPFALLAALFLLSGVILAWSIGRPRPLPAREAEQTSEGKR